MKTVLIILVSLSSMTLCLGQCSLVDEETLSDVILTEETSTHLQFLREEEYLAHDVYLYMYEKYELRPFDNIRKSELRHTEAVKALLNKYEISDPSLNHEAGIFQNRDLQDLYNELIKQGEASLEGALKVGLLIEEKDIQDLKDALSTVDEDSDIYFTLSNLKRASGNHLRAFHFNVESRDYAYTPVILDEEEFQEILNQ